MRTIIQSLIICLCSSAATVAQEAVPGKGFAAVPGHKGGQDISGAYDVVEGWPIDTATLPGHEGWTMGAGEAIFPESPDRVFVLVRGEIPTMERSDLVRGVVDEAVENARRDGRKTVLDRDVPGRGSNR